MLNICCVCTVRKGCLERQLFLEKTAQSLQMMEELLVHSYVVQNAGGEALVQNTDELVKVPRVHDTAPQPSRGDRQDVSSDLLAQAVFCLNRWVLCIHTVEERRVLASPSNGGQVSCVGHRATIPWIRVSLFRLFWCAEQMLDKAPHRINSHEELPQLPLHQHLPDELQAFLQAGLVRTSSRPVSVADFFGVLGVVEGFLT